MLPRRKLGRTDLEVTQLGYGSMGLRGPHTWGVRVVEDAQAESFLNEVLDAGINFIDTAPDYGVAEERIGRFISHRRAEYLLATKCGCDYEQHAEHIEIRHTWQPEVIERNIATSLKRMQTDYLDLLQFHGGDAETLQARGLIDLLLKYKQQGVIRHLGISSKLPELAELLKLGVFETFQIPYSCLSPEHEDCIYRAHESGAGVIIRGGIAHGGPQAEIQRPSLNQVWEAAQLDELVDEGQSKAQFILRYTLSHPGCDTTIVGTCNAAHLQENIQALQAGPLPAETIAETKLRVQAVSNP